MTSATPNSVRRAICRDVNGELSKYDVFICSPAMTAGSSFTVPGYFTRVVACFENMGLEGPTVDGAMQQWARVRNIGADGGLMDIFVVNRPSYRQAAPPTDEAGIDAYLQGHIDLVKGFFLQPARDLSRVLDRGSGTWQYNKDSLAYTCLAGNVYMRGLSMSSYHEVVEQTLREYNFDIEAVDVAAAGAEVPAYFKQAVRVTKQMEAMLQASVRYPNCKEVISREHFELLERKVKAKATEGQLTCRELQQRHVYMVIQQYQPEVDYQELGENFFGTYVGTYVAGDMRKVNALYIALKRWHHLVELEEAGVRQAYKAKAAPLLVDSESAIAFFNSSVHGFWQPLLLGMRLLTEIGVKVPALASGEEVVLRIDEASDALSRWTAKVTDSEYAEMRKELRLTDRNLQTLAAVKKHCAKAKTGAAATSLIKKLLEASLGLEMGPGKQVGWKENKHSVRPLFCQTYDAAKNRYKCKAFQSFKSVSRNYFKQYRFVEGEEASAAAV